MVDVKYPKLQLVDPVNVEYVMGGATRPFDSPSGKRYYAGGKLKTIQVEREDAPYLLGLKDSQGRDYFTVPAQAVAKAPVLPAYLMAQPASPLVSDNDPQNAAQGNGGQTAGLTIDEANDMKVDDLRAWITNNTDMNVDEIERSDERHDLPPTKADLIAWLVGMEIVQ